MRTALFAAALVAFSVALLAPRTARADEPVSAKEPRLLSETGESTTVIDAFDDDDPFDLSLLLGFEQTFKHASIRRETSLAEPGRNTGGFTSRNENVAAFDQSVTLLALGADVGLYKDLALLFRFPIILSDARELSDLEGSAQNASRFQDSKWRAARQRAAQKPFTQRHRLVLHRPRLRDHEPANATLRSPRGSSESKVASVWAPRCTPARSHPSQAFQGAPIRSTPRTSTRRARRASAVR